MYVEDFWQLGDYIATITNTETELIQENEILNKYFSIIRMIEDYVVIKHINDTDINMFYNLDDANEYVKRWCSNG